MDQQTENHQPQDRQTEKTRQARIGAARQALRDAAKDMARLEAQAHGAASAGTVDAGGRERPGSS